MKKFLENPRRLLITAVLFGIFVDFFFNAVIVKYVFHSAFKEDWAFIYVPVYLVVGGTISNFVPVKAVMIFFLGIFLGHLVLVGHSSTHGYEMILVSEKPDILLRSKDWPQILFVESDSVLNEIHRQGNVNAVPIKMAAVTDYGCIRSEVISTVAGIDVKNDPGATWTWRLDDYAKTPESKGPGNEDLVFPWCSHIVGIKMMEDGPTRTRPWDKMLQKIDP